MTNILIKIISAILSLVLLLTGGFTVGMRTFVKESKTESSATTEYEPEVITEEWGDAEYAMEEAIPDVGLASYAVSAPMMAQYDSAYGNAAESYWPYDPYNEPYNNEKYESTEENPFKLVATEPLSTFAADVDTASYANVRRMITEGWSLDYIYPDAVRPEEFVNYFSYDLKDPEAGDKFGVTTKIAPCPWNKEHQLLFIGMKTEDIDLSEAPDQNLVFLIDVSGSMDEDNKLPLLKKTFLQLLDQLDENDTVSIVTYANGVETVLSGAKCDDKDQIRDAIEGLVASGGTYGEGGIQRAYEIAERNFLKDGNNRVILATDGDLNIGISEPDQLERLITEKKDSGVYLSVLGFGMYNYRDDNMERLADCGNGNYAYIDSLLEAKKVLVEEMGSTLLTVADDVKLQVEFNPEKVNAYRLIGYENRLMNATDFRDETKDAGEIGAGHSVVALYELVPEGSAQAITLKYQGNNSAAGLESDVVEGAEGQDIIDGEEAASDLSAEYATVFIRYKEPGEDTAKENDYPVTEESYSETPDDDFKFAAAAAEFAMILQNSKEKGEASLPHLRELLKDINLEDEYRQEFQYLVRKLEGQNY